MRLKVQPDRGAQLAVERGAVNQRAIKGASRKWCDALHVGNIEMKTIRLLALAACTALSSPSFAATFSNNWSFVDQATGQTVSGVISGLVDGDDLGTEGLTVTVTQSPYAVFLGTYEWAFSAEAGYPSNLDSYSAANGVITFANFIYANEMGEFIQFGSSPESGGRYPQITSNTGVSVFNQRTGMQFSAVTTVVPEPASWAMLLGGFCLIGTAIRRKKTTVYFS